MKMQPLGDEQRRPCCPLCGAALGRAAFPYESVWKDVVYTRRRCNGCGAVVVDPMPDPSTLRDTYEWGSYHAPEYLAAEANEAERHVRTIQLLNRQLSETRSLLDFGCGSGEFLRLVRGLGIRCEGVEYTDSAIREAARRAGVPVSSLSALEERRTQFDLIHLCDVLPHLSDPRRTMRQLEALLAPGGRILVHGPLEENASIVLWSSKLIKALRRRLGRDRVAVRPPTMLFRLDLNAQRTFFRSLGYREEYFEVYETGWPLRTNRSFGLRTVLGWLAVVLSSLDPSRPRHLGNRFLAVIVQS